MKQKYETDDVIFNSLDNDITGYAPNEQFSMDHRLKNGNS
jgi:hypothetical protein